MASCIWLVHLRDVEIIYGLSKSQIASIKDKTGYHGGIAERIETDIGIIAGWLAFPHHLTNNTQSEHICKRPSNLCGEYCGNFHLCPSKSPKTAKFTNMHKLA